MSRYARKVDERHAEIVRALRDRDCWVLDLSKVGGGVPDLLAYRPHVATAPAFLEVKTLHGKRSPKAAERNTAQLAWADGCPLDVHVVTSPEEALAVFGFKPRPQPTPNVVKP